ncbi:serine/threonine-protein kinase ATR [Sinocyclocheilus grahami]|uniref:serine/threonine-protein kinase ATR n=1 Tax=Sinocyclocheilus grahami TaxID=75366 RepID=UPI0007ACA936|nr:PREDICTED: serine/threonine-protein kinase ATR [Sinocyclocheilus grahami]
MLMDNSAQTRAHCVFLLALLSKSVCGDWRSSVYRWALQSNSESERASAVRGFPLLLHNLGVKSYSLIHEVLLNRLQDSSTEVKIELAGITGQLACCLSESSQLQFPQDMMPSHELLCVGLSISDSHPSQTSSIGASIIPSFLLLLKSVEDKKVKQAFIRNIRHLFKHVDLGNSDPDTKSLVSALVNLIEDPDQDVRIKFGLNIKNLLEFWNGNGFLKELLVSRLKEAYTNAKTSRNNELKNTLILTTGEIGRAAEGNLVSFALLRLLHCLLSKSNPVSVAAYTEIQALATCRHLKLQSFFNQYRNPICQFLVESLHSRHVTALRCTPDQSSEALQEEAAHQRELALDILSHVAHVFDFPDLNRFLNRTLQVLLPFLAAKASPTASALIRTIAKQLNVNRREMLINNFKYIFSHLVCSCTKEELERAFHYLKNETEIELGSLLRQDFQGLHNELLLRLGEHYQQVFNGLAILASFASSDDPYQGPREITTPGRMADYLQPKLLGILAFFNMQLLSSSAGEKEKKKMALNSLMALMKLMGPKHISSVRVKMMTTLHFYTELLSLFECREGRTDSPGRRLWRRFPEQVQEILEPHLNTRYKSSQKVVNWSKLKKPVYLTSRGSKFSDWSATWAAYLISKVRHELAGKVFNCCSFIIKHDYKVTIYLLPHILVYVLIGCTQEEQREVNEEMMAVLKEGDPRLVRLQENASSLSQLSTQTVFSMLDHLTQWSRHKLQSLSTNKRPGKHAREQPQAQATGPENSEYQSVVAFLNRIPQDVLAKASFRSRAYTRAVMHFESFIREKKQNIQDHLSFLQTMYAAMHEPDGVRGVNDLRKEEPSLREQILEHESIGLLRESTACYDRAIQLEPDQIVHYHGVMNSMLGLGQLSTVITQVNGVLASRPRWKSDLNAYRVEAAWKLSKWDLVEDYIASDCKSSTWGVRLGQMLLAGKKQDSEAFYEKLKVARKEQVVPLSAASFECGTYQRGYEYIVRLHMLCELEHAFTELQKESRDAGGSKKPEPKLNWDARLLMTQNSFRAKEPVLALRRALLSLSKGSSCEEQVGECWLQSARVARRAGHHQTAFNALLNAENSLSELFIEKAKWLWSKGDVHQALIVLQKGVQQCFPDEQPLTDPKRIQIKGNAMLLVGRYMEETANFESNAIMKTYKDVTHLLPEWEDGNFYLAKYYDKVMPMVTDNKLERQGNLIRYIVTYFGKALQFGNQYIYQAMPRMLTLWLDFGAKVYEFEKAGRSDRAQMRAELTKINSVISEHTSNLSPYQFLTAFSQLISRICHSNNEVFAVLMEIVAKVFLAYPQQAMWMMTAVSKSSYPTRMNRCKEILKKAVSLNESFGKFIGDANRLTDKLVELGNKPVDGNSSTLSMSVHFKMLKKLVEEPTFSQILIPLQSVLIPTLPSTGGANPKHDAFPGHWVYLGGFDDTVEILASLQKPKKISLKGSDGKFYTMMCKPKDDLRKDCRLMEFNCLINKSLRKDAESRRRDLHIRTYAVIPLNEECGIIEWVNNTAGVRHILTKLYKEKGIYVSGTELRKLILPKTASFQEKLKLHKDVLCARHPPVFHEWFLRTFPDPTSWYNSRSAYCRSTAVMSMVGYILGLGDRHGENILFDSLTGECVHVDFNCLFNKGETFDVPEVVPFRLTQNMVHAMGPMGTEGLFRQACEVTLRLMRDQREPLMSVLKTFLHDPLVEWSKPVKGSSKTQVNESGEILNEKAKTHVLDIDQRLQGVIKNRNKVMGLPLSIEGHAHYLIQEATDDNLLCLMYLGWGPYL